MDTGILSVKVSSKSLVWRIPDFFSIPSNVDSPLDSSPFDFADDTWRLLLYPYGQTLQDSVGFVDVILVRVTSNLSHQNVNFSVLLLDVNREHYESFFETYRFDEHSARQGVVMFCERRIMLTDAAKIAPNGALELVFQLSSNESFVTEGTSRSLNALETLSQDYKNLLQNGENYDLTIKVGDKTFRAHSDILRARSQVFNSMLSHNMTEKNSGVIDVSDCDPQAIEQFLLYMYSGKVEELGQDNMQGLYYAADKYDMIHLKEECHKFIKKSLSSTNICDTITLAVNHSDSVLLEFATEYFVNNINNILPTIEWMTFMKEKSVLANELLIKSAKMFTSQKT